MIAIKSDLIPVYDLGDLYSSQDVHIDAESASGTAPSVTKFEQAFVRTFDGISYAVATSSGSSAIVAALWAHGVRRGDYVAVPDYTILSVATSCSLLGAVPVSIQIEHQTLGMDFDTLEECLKKLPIKAVVLCHLFGMKNRDSDKIYNLCHRQSISIIDDCSQSMIDETGRLISSGDKSSKVASLYFNKMITAGEGGVIYGCSPEVSSLAKSFVNLGFGSEAERFNHLHAGFNFRMSGLAAQLACYSLSILDRIVDQKKRIKALYLSHLCDVTIPAFANSPALLWMFPVVLYSTEEKRELVARAYNQFQTRDFYTPLSLQPSLRGELISFVPDTDKHQFLLSSVYIPSGLGLSGEEISRISKCVKVIQ